MWRQHGRASQTDAIDSIGGNRRLDIQHASRDVIIGATKEDVRAEPERFPSVQSAIPDPCVPLRIRPIIRATSHVEWYQVLEDGRFRLLHGRVRQPGIFINRHSEEGPDVAMAEDQVWFGRGKEGLVVLVTIRPVRQ
jgi:hypothetical protein